MRILICLFFSLSLSCKGGREVLSPVYGTELGPVDRRISEASGLVASITNPGLLWTINDSGNGAEIFLIDQHAVIRMTCILSDVENRDWEDIGIGRDLNGKPYLYVADIGDNLLQYENKLIYRLEEPVLANEEVVTINQLETYDFRMPDGKRDAETMLIDPDTNQIYLITKDEDSVGLYRAPNPLTLGSSMLFEKVSKLPFTKIVAGSISEDGCKVLLKNYDKIYCWEKNGNETVPEILSGVPEQLAYRREQQGEAICWSNDAKEFYTLSESVWWKSPANLIVHYLQRR